MKISVIPEDLAIVIDSEAVRFDAERYPVVPEEVHAYQWDGSAGEIEYKERGKLNDSFTDEAFLNDYKTAHADEKARVLAEQKAAEEAAKAEAAAEE